MRQHRGCANPAYLIVFDDTGMHHIDAMVMVTNMTMRGMHQHQTTVAALEIRFQTLAELVLAQSDM
jgi:hypothetical protein